jgi:hypothetical protein
MARSSYSVAFVGQSLIKEDVLRHEEQAFRDVAALIRSSDFAFTGYEGTIRGAHGGWPMKSTFLTHPTRTSSTASRHWASTSCRSPKTTRSTSAPTAC